MCAYFRRLRGGCLGRTLLWGWRLLDSHMPLVGAYSRVDTYSRGTLNQSITIYVFIAPGAKLISIMDKNISSWSYDEYSSYDNICNFNILNVTLFISSRSHTNFLYYPREGRMMPLHYNHKIDIQFSLHTSSWLFWSLPRRSLTFSL